MALNSSGDMLADRRLALAIQFFERGDLGAAADLARQAIEVVPAYAPFHFRLGEIYAAAGQRDDAIGCFSRYLTLDAADAMGAIIKLSLLGAAPAPAALPAGYVEALFDDYAPRFDVSLMEKLAYNVPQRLADTVQNYRPAAAGSERILDLGCGTGLAGETFIRRAAWLEGLDISAGMIAQAEAKRLYNRLLQADICDLSASTAGLSPPYDLVIAADVLVYIGALDRLFDTVAGLLAPGGLFAFSVQKLDAGDGFRLGADHRYAHSRAYIEQAAANAGLRLASLSDAVIRQDGGYDVNGLIGLVEASRPCESEVILATRRTRPRSRRSR